MSIMKTLKDWGAFVGLIGLLLGAAFGINTYIDWRIDQKVSDEQFLKKVGMSARPFCIFDNKGSIHFDSGAMQFIGYSGKSPIDLSDLTKDGMPKHITVHFNRLFTYPPTLTVLGAGLYSCRPERGQGYDWIYTVYSADALLAESSTIEPPSGEQDYKLEILY